MQIGISYVSNVSKIMTVLKKNVSQLDPPKSLEGRLSWVDGPVLPKKTKPIRARYADHILEKR